MLLNTRCNGILALKVHKPFCISKYTHMKQKYVSCFQMLNVKVDEKEEEKKIFEMKKNKQ